MCHWFDKKERRWLEMKEAHYPSWAYEFFNALEGRTRRLSDIIFPHLDAMIDE